MTRAYSYLRGSNPSPQQEFAEKFCAEKGWKLDEELTFEDQGKNARVGFLKDFLEAVQSGRIRPGSVLIVDGLDRLVRAQMETALELLRDILKAGITIATTSPERIYTEENLNDLASILEPLLYMSRPESNGR